jgi:hypothetical protein
MAQVIIEDREVVARTWMMWGRTIILGALMGLIFWLVTVLVGRYAVEPLVCRQVVDAAMCTNATSLAGNISAVLVAALAIIAMVRIGVARPIIIAAATAAVLWNLSTWTMGLFWVEAIIWSVLLYALSYALFAWITRYVTLWVTIVISLVIVVIIRIAAAL